MQIAATNIAAVGKMKKTWTTSRAMPILSAAKSIFSWQQVKPAVFQAQGQLVSKLSSLCVNNNCIKAFSHAFIKYLLWKNPLLQIDQKLFAKRAATTWSHTWLAPTMDMQLMCLFLSNF